MFNMSCKEKRQDTKIFFYDKGKEVTIDSKLTGYAELIRATENLLVGADDMLRLAVDSELIRKIKKQESAIEVIFPIPTEFTINYNKAVIHPDRILIPLFGEFTGADENPPATIFHGYPEYSAGPYRNSKGLGQLKKILYDMGVK